MFGSAWTRISVLLRSRSDFLYLSQGYSHLQNKTSVISFSTVLLQAES